ESRIHAGFTNMADDLFGQGYLTRAERIALSGAIGDALDAYNVTVSASAPQLAERGIYDEAPDDAAPAKSADLSPYAVKFIGDNEIEGYSLIWGSPDA